MSIHVALRHVTEYRYDRPVSLSPQQVRLRPAPHCRTRVLAYSQRVTPAGHFINWQQDPHGNYIARLTFPEKVTEFRVEVDLVAEMAVYNPFDFFLEPRAENYPFAYDEVQQRELQPYLEVAPASAQLTTYMEGIDRRPRRTVDFLVDLNQLLQRDVRYLVRLEPGVQTPDETLRLRSGSCRDTTWLLVQICRRLGLAARFVSGYLIQLVADVKPVSGPAGPANDFTDLHAWCEVYLPGAGWVGLDPTSGLLAGEGHLPLACTPDPTSAAPITGAVEKCEVQFGHDMAVHRIVESPRVTKPYTDGQWQAIRDLGHAVDADLAANDVRLTMGGEPTFVSATDRNAAEWKTEALGPTKRQHALALLRRLKQHYAPGGFIHAGQGKWYPGEQLPRWALGCYWRADGVPAWSDDSLWADEEHPDAHTAADAARFIRALAAELGVSDAHVQPGYEDTWYYLWRERRLPTNVDPFDSRLDDELERARLHRVFTRGLDAVVGHALPLTHVGQHHWATGPWFLRAERMYLVPGDSPMGFRLPLDSLPWSADTDARLVRETDPFAPRPPLPAYATAPRGSRPAPLVQERATGSSARGFASSGAGTHAAEPPVEDAVAVPVRGLSAEGIVRFALCVEPRGGVLYVFMPPVPTLEAYLDLVAAIERTAAREGCRILIEGYPPPHDPRLTHFLITPDPGVIEVNIQPASGWAQLVEQTTTLYEEARQCGLSTETFQLDGRHTGTGGGNHFVLGGPTAADSPFLRRPDLLRSLVGYWHNHPSLSYLFSGLFIGPTSQAPRIDEARHDSVYEIELAFSKLPPSGQQVPPWLVDRSLRNLLVDVTGNTHRAEFCIDKLYSPDGPAGRRGLVELRAFEMPPDARMSLAQQLLLRALVSRFWRTPYEAPLTRWGTELHDRFMLPYFVWLDFQDVAAELRQAGYAVDAAWFAPHFEFRFPVAGELSAHAIELTLRQALEPWHVLGEEGAIGGTVRYVDASLERLQVHVSGLTPGRYVVTCNGRPVPLQPTGRNGEFVGGVRYRAWQPPSALHPTIPVHAPLTFDIVDTWMERSVAGCQYHVQHPGGRNPEVYPLNSFEAESRRLARFSRLAHTPGRVVVTKAARSCEFPYTLDLRAD
ncbi:MAG: DUF2126 domain-containing protein [Vicinamibacterales bacterium]